MNVKNFIEDVLLEAAIDSRVKSGVVELYNCEHLTVIVEKMRDKGLGDSDIDLILNEIVIKDGKYPDRQAYNEEGWLVTFPSKDYRDVAIKKGTHFISDPTHGKGGMNLYYKKRGKQKRQSQQDRTISEPVSASPEGAKTADASGKPSSTAPTSTDKSAQSAPADSNAKSSPSAAKSASKAGGEPVGDELPPAQSVGGVASGGGGGGSSANNNGQVPAPSAPTTPVAPLPPPYADLSIRFAEEKGWVSTPYGEWRNPIGEVSAVVGLTGEVVPIKQVEREEFKLFAEKNTA